MKRQTMQQVTRTVESDDDCLTVASAEAVLHREIAELGDWLIAQGFDLRGDQSQADEGSRDRLYWHYGYFIGLKHALTMLTGGGATLH